VAQSAKIDNAGLRAAGDRTVIPDAFGAKKLDAAIFRSLIDALVLPPVESGQHRVSEVGAARRVGASEIDVERGRRRGNCDVARALWRPAMIER
jgi:hypothetical protein